MTRRFVFVPLAGVATGADWLKFPHAKAWGFLVGDDELQFTPLHVEGVGADCIPLNEPCGIFDAEIDQAIDVPENSTDLPDEVCVALAKMALCPQLAGVTEQ